MISDFYPPILGGVEIVVQTLAVALRERGHEVSIATIRTAQLPRVADEDGVRIHRIPLTASRSPAVYTEGRPWAPPVGDPEAVLALRRIVRRERPDVVHGHDWLARSFLPLRRKTDAALVMSLHYYTLTCAKKNLMHFDEPCSGPRLAKCLRCAGDHYGALKAGPIVVSNFAAAWHEQKAVDLFVPVSHATAVGNGLVGSGLAYEVIHNPVLAAPIRNDAAAFAAQLPGEPFLLFVGDLRRTKGLGILLQAYDELNGDRPPLVLIGKRWTETPSRLPRGATMLTDWPNAAVREAQRRCLALVAPSVWPEPFGMVVAEALACGRPAVVSRIGGLTDLVTDGVNGLVVRPGDVGELNGALATIVGDREVREGLARNAARSRDRFSVENVVPRFERAYERAITLSRRRLARRLSPPRSRQRRSAA
jgi:glycosyltransferase involved in cell wall biosynthesis